MRTAGDLASEVQSMQIRDLYHTFHRDGMRAFPAGSLVTFEANLGSQD